MKYYNDYIVSEKILKKNCLEIKKILTNNTKLCAIVKADAYGLGYETICRALYGYVDFWGVANVCEAMKIRQFDSATKILVLGVVGREDFEICSKNDISISVSSLAKLQEIKQSKIDLKVHLQINTGLNRFGIRSLSDFKKALKVIEYSSNIRLEGVYSHFATKEKDRLFINIQYYKFLQFKNIIKNDQVICHIANSCATGLSDKYHLDMVRTGFSLYQNVLKIKSKIIEITEIKKGDTIGYDRTFLAKNKMKIAVVSIGYADGLDRRLSNNFSLIVNDKKCPIVGLICMDVCMVDITDIDADIGDEVIILGKSKNQEITIFDYASALSTSPYEILLKFNHKRMNYINKE